MTKYEINLTNVENLSLSYVAKSQLDWIENMVKSRCKTATAEIVSITVNKCLETQTNIPNSEEEIVELAFTKGWVKSVEQKNEEFENSNYGLPSPT